MFKSYYSQDLRYFGCSPSVTDLFYLVYELTTLYKYRDVTESTQYGLDGTLSETLHSYPDLHHLCLREIKRKKLIQLNKICLIVF